VFSLNQLIIHSEEKKKRRKTEKKRRKKKIKENRYERRYVIWSKTFIFIISNNKAPQ